MWLTALVDSPLVYAGIIQDLWENVDVDISEKEMTIGQEEKDELNRMSDIREALMTVGNDVVKAWSHFRQTNERKEIILLLTYFGELLDEAIDDEVFDSLEGWKEYVISRLQTQEPQPMVDDLEEGEVSDDMEEWEIADDWEEAQVPDDWEEGQVADDLEEGEVEDSDFDVDLEPSEEEETAEKKAREALLRAFKEMRQQPSKLPTIDPPLSCWDPYTQDDSKVKFDGNQVVEKVVNGEKVCSTVELLALQLADPNRIFYRVKDGKVTSDPSVVSVYGLRRIYVKHDDILTALKDGADVLVYSPTEEEYEETISQSVRQGITGALVGGTHGGPGTAKKIHDVQGFRVVQRAG